MSERLSENEQSAETCWWAASPTADRKAHFSRQAKVKWKFSFFPHFPYFFPPQIWGIFSSLCILRSFASYFSFTAGSSCYRISHYLSLHMVHIPPASVSPARSLSPLQIGPVQLVQLFYSLCFLRIYLPRVPVMQCYCSCAISKLLKFLLFLHPAPFLCAALFVKAAHRKTQVAMWECRRKKRTNHISHFWLWAILSTGSCGYDPNESCEPVIGAGPV